MHAHLESSRFEKDLDKVVERAGKAGVKFILNSGVNPETNRKALNLSEKYKIVKCSFGLYPIDALIFEEQATSQRSANRTCAKDAEFLRDVEEFDVDEELKWIEENKDKCIAIGEVGLDYNWKEFQTEELKEKQKEVFRKVICLAKKIGKPLIIHSRKAELDAIEILEEEIKNNEIDIVMHCFSGNKKLIKRCAGNGWFFSVPPVILRLEHFKMLVGLVDIKQLLTETDSPYLSPKVGERNEPANVAVTIKEIAKIKGLSEEEVAERVFENAVGVFNLKNN